MYIYKVYLKGMFIMYMYNVCVCLYLHIFNNVHTYSIGYIHNASHTNGGQGIQHCAAQLFILEHRMQSCSAPVVANPNAIGDPGTMMIKPQNLSTSGHFWALLGTSGHFWALLGTSGHFWALLGTSGHF